MELKTLKTGESLTIGILIGEAYDLEKIKELKVYVGNRVYPHTLVARMIRCELASNKTKLLEGTVNLTLWLEETAAGVRIMELGELIFDAADASYTTAGVNTGYNVVVPLNITEETVEVGAVMYNFLKGVDGLTAYQIWLAAGNEGTQDDYLAWQKQPAIDAASVLNEIVEVADTVLANALQATIDANEATNSAQAAATLANSKATLADQKASLAAQAATNANNFADAADEASTRANESADIADEKAVLANEKATLANQAATDANAAKVLALEVADHPDVVVNEYWHKWNLVSHAYETTGIKAKGENGIYGVVRNIDMAAYDVDHAVGDQFTKTCGAASAFTISNAVIFKPFRMVITGGTLAATLFTGYTTNWIISSLIDDYVPASVNYLICEIRSAGQIYCFWGE